MRKFATSFLLLFALGTCAFAQVPGNEVVAPDTLPANATIPGKKGMVIPHGTTADRAVPPKNATIRINDTTGLLEYYSTSLGWQTTAGGGGGGSGGETMPTSSFNSAGTAVFGFNFADASTAPFTVTVPTAVGNLGKIVETKKVDLSGNSVSVTTQLGQTIDSGGVTYSLSQPNQCVSLISDGSNWKIK